MPIGMIETLRPKPPAANAGERKPSAARRLRKVVMHPSPRCQEARRRPAKRLGALRALTPAAAALPLLAADGAPALEAANREELLPRKPLPAPQPLTKPER